MLYSANIIRYSVLTPHPIVGICGVIIFTYVAPDPDPQDKRLALQRTGTLNPRASRVRHVLFASSEFFDPSDLLQLKYETVRAVEHESYSIVRAAKEFGLSRPTIYQAQRQFREQGLEGLLPSKRGPKGGHKLTLQIQDFIEAERRVDPHVPPRELAARVRKRFKVRLHPRTIEKALHPRAKRGRQTQR
jgi:transposase